MTSVPTITTMTWGYSQGSIRTLGQEKEWKKGIKIGKEETKPTFFAGDDCLM